MTALNPATISAPKISAHTCVRCNAVTSKEMGQVRATCSQCAFDLRTLHNRSEYALYRKRYYICSPEGTSLQELLQLGYKKDIVMPYATAITVEDQVPKKMVPT